MPTDIFLYCNNPLLFSDQKVSHLTLDSRLDSHYSQPGPGSSFGTMGTMATRLGHKTEADSDR